MSSGATRATTPMLVDLLVELGVGERRELGAGQRPALDSELGGDRGRGRRVVAGDHAGADPRLLAAGDRVPRLLARRIDDADEREQRQPLDLVEQRAVGVETRPGSMSREATASTRSPSPARRSFSARTRSRPASAGTAEPSASRKCDERASRTSGAPLTKQRMTFRPSVLHLVEGRHQLVLGVERHLGHARVDAPRLVDVDPALLREHDERRLRRVSDDLAVANGGVVRERHRQQERLERRVRLARDAEDLAFGRVALAFDRVAPADDHELARRHLVERQRAGLVRADRRRRAERLHRAQPLHDRALGGERLRPQREHGRDDRGEAGRDRGDREADPDQEELVEVVAANEPENDDERQRGSPP